MFYDKRMLLLVYFYTTQVNFSLMMWSVETAELVTGFGCVGGADVLF
jgi:hypothetical protein